MESSVKGILVVLTGLGPGPWVWGTGGHYCLLTKEGVNYRLTYILLHLVETINSDSNAEVE